MSRFFYFFIYQSILFRFFLEIGIGVGGVGYIAEALKVNTTLTVFDLICE